MPHSIIESCINCKCMSCVQVCPTNCFHEGPNFLTIDPNLCIDCTLCIRECPVDAIYPNNSIPKHQKHFIRINNELSMMWPLIKKGKSNKQCSIGRWKILKQKMVFLRQAAISI